MWKNAEWLRNYIDSHTWVAIILVILCCLLIIIFVVFLVSVYVRSETPWEWIENIAKALELLCIPWCAVLLYQTNIILKSIDSKISN